MNKHVTMYATQHEIMSGSHGLDTVSEYGFVYTRTAYVLIPVIPTTNIFAMKTIAFPIPERTRTRAALAPRKAKVECTDSQSPFPNKAVKI